jgi:hypothetical protein
MKKLLLVISLIFWSCSSLLDSIDEYDRTQIKVKNNQPLSIIFSHNINGETHPCGCRHFPLGGLPQVAGMIQKVKKSNPLIYVDTGDAFFPSSTIPETLKNSLIFTAENIAKSFDMQNLEYFVPGDQDFAAGIQFLQKIANNYKFKFLISNLKDPKLIKHKRWAQINYGKKKIFLLGFVNPDLINTNKYFLPIETTLEKIIPELSSQGYSPNNPLHRLILLTHNGIDNDTLLAKTNHKIDWIIGSHSQSFTRLPRKENNTKLVQVLSRNHYLGEIKISDNKDKYNLLEIRDELKSEISPNPFINFIDRHKSDLSVIQEKEQQSLTIQTQTVSHLNTASSCIECHTDQGDHWKKTSHSIAMLTLINNKSEHNLQCLKCHTLGQNSPGGYQVSKQIVTLPKTLTQKKYWDLILSEVKTKQAVRKLSKKQKSKLSNLWLDLDEKNGVIHNLSNVQCLNCHTKNPDHPFVISDKKTTQNKYESIKNKCLSCHTNDQSIHWYDAQSKSLKESNFNKYYNQIKCPKYQE